LIGACAIARNEADGIAEWIAYHLAIGFDALIVYDNASTDETRQLVAKMSRVGDVRCIEWKDRTTSFQMQAYQEALERFGAEFEWLFFLDADEFVLPLSHLSIGPVMARYPSDVAAVGFNWMMYGSSGLEHQPEDLLVIEAFQRRSEPSFWGNRHVKSAVRPHRTLSCFNPHVFEVLGRYVLADGQEAEWESAGIAANPPSGHEAARINHYFTKSRGQWDAKLEKNRGNEQWQRDPADWDRCDRNEVCDDRILQNLETTRALLAMAGVLPPD
jgi:glycosyltransferase involved in cell wall biosynthesis